jgi:hypothetical protein
MERERPEPDLDRLARIEAGVWRYMRAMDEGTWTPAEDERLVRLVIPEWNFPWDSVPPEPELAAGCERYQKGRAESYEFPNAPPADAGVETKLAYYDERIRTIAARRGQDLCWETDGLGQLVEPLKSLEKAQINAPENLRCLACAAYRTALYTAGGSSRKNHT